MCGRRIVVTINYKELLKIIYLKQKEIKKFESENKELKEFINSFFTIGVQKIEYANAYGYLNSVVED